MSRRKRMKREEECNPWLNLVLSLGAFFVTSLLMAYFLMTLLNITVGLWTIFLAVVIATIGTSIVYILVVMGGLFGWIAADTVVEKIHGRKKGRRKR